MKNTTKIWRDDNGIPHVEAENLNDMNWGIAIPRMMASNNGVISGSKTASGKPIIANDPHLEVNRLPNVWSEIVLEVEGRHMIGGSMPGFPSVLIGRGKEVSWAMTYSFLDAVDSWIEHCKDGRCYREDGDPTQEGYYLSKLWAPSHSGTATVKMALVKQLLTYTKLQH